MLIQILVLYYNRIKQKSQLSYITVCLVYFDQIVRSKPLAVVVLPSPLFANGLLYAGPSSNKLQQY